MLIDFSHLKINDLKPKTDFENKVVLFLEEWQKSSEAIMVSTSGSTGSPKKIEIFKKKMLISAKNTCDFLGLVSGNKALLALPIEYISGKMMVVRALERKLKLKVVQPSTLPLENISEEYDFCALTPLQAENSLPQIHWIKNLIIGGAAVSDGLKNKIHEKLSDKKTKVYETYGMSETISHIALKEIFPRKENYFTIFPDVKISKDVRNCLQIDAPKINDGILITNDIVEIINDHQFRFLGRADFVINSGGAKIFPEELEEFIKKEILAELAIVGLKDDILGEKLVLVIEGLEYDEIKSKINGIIFAKNWHRPKEIYYIPKIPRTANGKINRIALKTLIEKIKYPND